MSESAQSPFDVEKHLAEISARLSSRLNRPILATVAWDTAGDAEAVPVFDALASCCAQALDELTADAGSLEALRSKVHGLRFELGPSGNVALLPEGMLCVIESIDPAHRFAVHQLREGIAYVVGASR